MIDEGVEGTLEELEAEAGRKAGYAGRGADTVNAATETLGSWEEYVDIPGVS